MLGFERFIAHRFMPRKAAGGHFSGPLSRVAVVGIALGVAVMVMAVSILRGFQSNISDKISGFGSHITIRNYSITQGYNGEYPTAIDSTLVAAMQRTRGVAHVQCFATKGGMVKTGDQICGIMLRGLSVGYDTTFYAQSLVAGSLPHADNDVLISRTIAKRMHLTVGDKMRTYFWQDQGYRSRAFNVVGIYNTDLAEVDDVCVLGTLHTVQRLNDWGDTLVGGYELLVSDFDALDATAARVLQLLPYDLNLQTVVGANPALFSWLDLLNSNIVLILAIMCLVCAVAIISAMLIMIFEKSATIGLLKALGSTATSIRNIFIIKATGLIASGIAIGDAVAVALSWAQEKWHIVRLDPESYSMSYVPVQINAWIFAWVSIGVLVVCMLALLLPTTYIARISPAQTLRTEN